MAAAGQSSKNLFFYRSSSSQRYFNVVQCNVVLFLICLSRLYNYPINFDIHYCNLLAAEWIPGNAQRRSIRMSSLNVVSVFPNRWHGICVGAKLIFWYKKQNDLYSTILQERNKNFKCYLYKMSCLQSGQSSIHFKFNFYHFVSFIVNFKPSTQIK